MAVAIFVHNARAILGVFGLLLIAQLAARHPGGPGRAQRLILAGGELILAGVIAANVLVVGAGLGAYGERMARAELPHGPVELAAYALALALYLQGRRRALPRQSPGQGRGGERRAARARRRARDLRERMRPLRVLLVLLLIGGGVGASLVLVSKADAIAARLPALSALAVDDDGAARTTSNQAVRRERAAPATPHLRASAGAAAPRPAQARRQHGLPPGAGIPAAACPAAAVLVAGLEIAAGLLLLGLLLVVLALRRLRRRSRREYALYELHLSTHDQAKGQDLEDMVESIANIVRAWPADRLRDGQPYVALELICGGAPRTAAAMSWSGRSTSAASPERSPRSTGRSAPPTRTSGSAAPTARSPARARARCASRGT